MPQYRCRKYWLQHDTKAQRSHNSLARLSHYTSLLALKLAYSRLYTGSAIAKFIVVRRLN